MFRKFSVQASGVVALAALAVGAVLPGTADAAVTGAFSYPQVTVHLAGQTVAAPGRLEATLHTSACVSHVSAYAVNLRTGTVLTTTVDVKSGKTAVVTFTIPKAAKAGHYELAGAFGRPCANAAGEEQLNPAGGYFTAAFTVVAKR